MDEEALLKQFAAQFAHGPDDADDTDAAAAAQGADSTANQVADDADQSPATFDTQQFLNGLDAIFDRHTAATEAGPYLEQAMVDAENAGDEAGLLTVLNETMGFYRSQGRHKENQWIVQLSAGTGRSYGLDHRHIRGVGHHANQLRHLDARGQTIRSGRGFVSSGAECLPAFAGTHRP